MARPRRQQQPSVERATNSAALPSARESHLEETPEEARLADVLIALVGRHLLDTMDPMEPSMQKYWDWRAKQARDALTPQERVELRREAREFAKRMVAGHEARERAEAEGESPPARAPDIK